MKRMSIKTSILLPVLAILIAGIAAMVIIVGVLSSGEVNNLTDRLIDARVNEYTNEFRVLSGDAYTIVNAVTPMVNNYVGLDLANSEYAREDVVALLADALMSSDTLLGIWTCWEPDAFDGRDSQYAGTEYHDASGRFVPYLIKDGGSFSIEALVDYDDPVDGEYYMGAKTSGKSYITDPYMYNVGGKQRPIYSLTLPIMSNGKFIGAVGADIDLQSVVDVMNSASILDDGYVYVLSPGGLVATHSNADILMKRYDTTWMKNYSAEVENIIKNGGSFSLHAYSDVTNTNMSFLGNGVTIGDTNRYWVVCGVVPESTVQAASLSLLTSIIIIGVLLIAVVGVTILLFVRNRLKDLPILAAAADAIALGDIESSNFVVSDEGTKNEIILLENAFARMTGGIQQQAAILAEIARGDYAQSIPIRSERDVMNQAISALLDEMNIALARINLASDQVSNGAKQIADGSQALAAGATEQAASIQELSSSIGEVAVQTKDNAEMALRAAEVSGNVMQRAEEGNVQMGNMIDAVREINDANQNIGKVIKVIDDIAFQTNILALNAAVEAARAGSAGKGFSVVAEEVRNLAAKSAEAAKDTSGMIENSISKAELGVKIASQTAESLGEIVAGVNESTELVKSIADASEYQSNAINQINIGIDQVAQVVQQNSATAEESAASSQEMSGQADILAELVSHFKLKEDESSRRPRLDSYGRGDERRAMPPHRNDTNGGDFGKY